jgi:hypothetical protein
MLPVACPPAAACDIACEEAYRLLPSDRPQPVDFDSEAAKGKLMPLGMNDPCRWASCSLFCDMETIKKKLNLKNFRKYTHVARISVAAGSGMQLRIGRHIDFWMYDTFDPLKEIVHVGSL